MKHKSIKKQIVTKMILSVFFVIIGCAEAGADVPDAGGIYWPANQLLPIFPPLSAVIDDINEDYLTVPEAVALAALQGYVNSVQPRIVLSKNNGFDDGVNGKDPAFAARTSTVAGPMDPWLDALAPREGFTRNRILPTEVYATIADKYAGCIKGFVLYNCTYHDPAAANYIYLENWKRGDAAEWDISGVAPGTYDVQLNYRRQDNPSGAGLTNINWKVEIDGANGVTSAISSTDWWNNAANWYHQTLGQVTVQSGNKSLSVSNFNWEGNQNNYSFNIMNLRYLRLVPTSGNAILLGPGTAAFSNNEPNFPKRGIYHVEPHYSRLMTDYANLASSIAYPLGYLPVTYDVMQKINKALIAAGKQPVTTTVVITGNETPEQIDAIHADLKATSKVLDISGLKFELESYNEGNVSLSSCTYLYNNWWKFNSKRIMLNTLTDNAGRYRMSSASDIAAATGAARTGLDIDTQTNSTRPNIWKSRQLYEKFLYDMAQNRSATNETAGVMGWNIAEPAFIQASTTYAVGALPSQYFSSGSFFGGMNHDLNIPPVPKRDALDKQKTYIAVYMSDGDNLQFVQNQTGIIWMTNFNDIQNTKIPINWTIAPSLADIGPGMLNWFFDNTTVNNCFVAGPSGAQYITPVSESGDAGTYLGTNPGKTANKGPNDGKNNLPYAIYFAKLNEDYMRRTAIRVATLWQNFPHEVRNLLEQHNRYLYGATLQRGSPASGTTNGRLRFELFTNGLNYSNNRTSLKNGLKTNINNRNKSEPLFLHAQVDTWNRNDPDNANNTSVSVYWLNRMADELKAEYPNLDIEFVRADHWFSLYNEHYGIPFDLSILAATTVTSNYPGNGIGKLTNGSTGSNNVWESDHTTAAKEIVFNFGKVHTISRYVLRKAKISGTENFYEINNCTVSYSIDGTSYSPVTVSKNCSVAGVLGIAADIDIDIVPVDAQYVKITVNDPGVVRIANAEIYGKTDYIPPSVVATVIDKPNAGDKTNLMASLAEYGTGKFYPGLPNNGGFTFNGTVLMDWKNGDYATWNIDVVQEGIYKVSMYYSKTGAFDKSPLDIKIFKGNEMVIENGLPANEATGDWNTFRMKELGTINLTANDLTLSMTNDGSAGRPNNGAYSGTYAGGGLNYYRIQYLVLELVTPSAPPDDLSGDATLKSISVSSGALSPAFNANITDYIVNAANNVTEITITGVANHNGAKVEGNVTNYALNVGNNTVTITVTAEDGTVKTYKVTVIRANVITSVENAPVSPARIYPNPTNGRFILNFYSHDDHLVTITTTTGKVLHTQSVSDQTTQIDIGSYPKGVYLIVIEDGKQQSTTKIVKEE